MLVDVVAKSGEAAKSGPIGLAVILILCIVCYFLFKSMSKHLRKVREEYPGTTSEQPAPDAPRATTVPKDPPANQPSDKRPAE
jgi:hypothetical protein